MKNIFYFLAAFFVFSAFTSTNTLWKNDKAHSQLSFTVTHLGISDVSGYFKDFDVDIQSNKPDFSDASFKLTAKTSSIDTRIEARNNHLKSADFFDAANHPEITFVSTSISPKGNNLYDLAGDLTMRGVTKKITMELKHRGTVASDDGKKTTAGFSLSGTLKRSDFNIGEKFPEAAISDIVRIKADCEFIK